MLNYALRLLARREHSAYELQVKLKAKGLTPDLTEEIISKCQQSGLQSDQRFAELVCRTRARQGYGSSRIIQELQSKHVDTGTIQNALNNLEVDWLEAIEKVWQKKYAQFSADALTLADLKKQQQFLIYRGFPPEMVARFFKEKGSAELREE